MSGVSVMSRRFKSLGGLVSCWLLAGCTSSMGPLDWGTGYQASEARQPDARQAIQPLNCRLSALDQALVTLPPGCANDLNLRAMVARPQDLLQGRAPGPASAEPVATAALERLGDRERRRVRYERLGMEARSARVDGR